MLLYLGNFERAKQYIDSFADTKNRNVGGEQLMEIRDEDLYLIDFDKKQLDTKDFLDIQNQIALNDKIKNIENIHRFSTNYGKRLLEKNEGVAYFMYLGIAGVVAIATIFVGYQVSTDLFPKLIGHSSLLLFAVVLFAVFFGFLFSNVFTRVFGFFCRKYILKSDEVKAFEFHDPTETIRVNSDYLKIVRPEYMKKESDENSTDEL